MTKQGPHGIAWTDFTSNPIRYRDAAGKVVWHCEKLSPGCKNCYASALAKRMGKGGDFNADVTKTLTPFVDEGELRKLLAKEAIAGKRVFIGDMTDVFGEWIPDELLDRLFVVLAPRLDVTFQVLTKRPERARRYMERLDESTRLDGYKDWPALLDEQMPWLSEWFGSDRLQSLCERPDLSNAWPLPNVWLGTSCEDQKRAEERIPHLLNTPASVRFISAEPLLGPIDLRNLDTAPELALNALSGVEVMGEEPAQGPKLDWVIPGGESNGRECEVEWIRSLVKQCAIHRTSCFVKQLGSRAVIQNDTDERGWPGATVPLADDYEPRHQGEIAPLLFSDRKAGDPAAWPEDLRVREFPV